MKEYSGNSLTTSVVSLLTKGYSFARIADKLEVAQPDVVRVWQEYVESKHSMPFPEQFALQSERLESLLVTANEILTMQLDSDAVQALLKVLQELDSLHNLALSRREKVQADEAQLTKAQVGILLGVVSSIQAYMRESLMSITTFEDFQELQRNFNPKFNEISKLALEEVKNDQ